MGKIYQFNQTGNFLSQIHTLSIPACELENLKLILKYWANVTEKQSYLLIYFNKNSPKNFISYSGEFFCHAFVDSYLVPYQGWREQSGHTRSSSIDTQGSIFQKPYHQHSNDKTTLSSTSVQNQINLR